jgi:predicted RNase H-like nuclease (RuvC/YqgF family)
LRYVIAGIDTGKTAAIACVDLDGILVSVDSGRFAGMQWFVGSLRSVGSPVVVASDKRKPDKAVEKLASIFDAVLFTPESDISMARKRELAAGSVSNPHERDALSAALTAYNAYAAKLRHAAKVAWESDAPADRIKAMVIRKYSVHEAISGRSAGRRLVRRSGG